jgi:hypothetical protein
VTCAPRPGLCIAFWNVAALACALPRARWTTPRRTRASARVLSGVAASAASGGSALAGRRVRGRPASYQLLVGTGHRGGRLADRSRTTAEGSGRALFMAAASRQASNVTGRPRRPTSASRLTREPSSGPRRTRASSVSRQIVGGREGSSTCMVGRSRRRWRHQYPGARVGYQPVPGRSPPRTLSRPGSGTSFQAPVAGISGDHFVRQRVAVGRWNWRPTAYVRPKPRRRPGPRRDEEQVLVGGTTEAIARDVLEQLVPRHAESHTVTGAGRRVDLDPVPLNAGWITKSGARPGAGGVRPAFESDVVRGPGQLFIGRHSTSR